MRGTNRTVAAARSKDFLDQIIAKPEAQAHLHGPPKPGVEKAAQHSTRSATHRRACVAAVIARFLRWRTTPGTLLGHLRRPLPLIGDEPMQGLKRKSNPMLPGLNGKGDGVEVEQPFPRVLVFPFRRVGELSGEIAKLSDRLLRRCLQAARIAGRWSQCPC